MAEASCRKVIHIDADCFFAAIEMRDDPRLRDRPLAVGGDPSRRGVISTCNYEARQFGVRSAMASAHAKRLCPDLLIVPHNMARYREASAAMRDIFYDYTDLVEPLSLDEAFLDVSGSVRCQGSATRMAAEIRQRIASQLGITVSAGVAPNKFIAKVASDWNKPDGMTVVVPAEVDGFVRALPLRRIPGVGKVTAERLQRMGLETCADLRDYSLFELTRLLGSFGARLHALSRGEDSRPVKPSRTRKSLSVEHTFARDLSGVDSCLKALPELFLQLRQRLQRLGDERVIKAFIKLKFDDFTSTTLERVGTRAVLTDYQEMLAEAWQRGARPVRLLGLGVRLLDREGEEGVAGQLPLFGEQLPT
ncbi:DNA polymerase IV [Pseudomaricurvus sp. HS19]|uniref:DNA polymerase IV n=1 Tax=Pseudomaricurvus sp. HS19 TaxID=2692626 RepID=UPI001370B4CE|nr:DNA polymerase IV [Pseudomaricurvus sp. HS19]MYM64668.1 DNA polymerase IV [Pseudomaricurvus sp. HS19]